MSWPGVLDAVTDVLAIARIVRLVQVDEVPFGPARELVLDLGRDRKITELVRCGWCLSVWVAALVVFARRRWPRAWPILARVLAGSAAACYVAKIEDL